MPSLVSRRHARFVNKNDSVVVEDLGAKNGVLVNGRRVASAALHHGDVVTLGGMRTRSLGAHWKSGAGKAPVGAQVSSATSDLNFELVLPSARLKRKRGVHADNDVPVAKKFKKSYKQGDGKKNSVRRGIPKKVDSEEGNAPRRRGRPPKQTSQKKEDGQHSLIPDSDEGEVQQLLSNSVDLVKYSRRREQRGGSDDDSEASISGRSSSGEASEEPLYSDELDGLLDDAQAGTVDPDAPPPRRLRPRSKSGGKQQATPDGRFESAQADGPQRSELEGVRVRPYVCGPRVPGTLSVGMKHLHYINHVGELDLKYSAIEHVVFQPSRGGIRAIIQVFLRKPRRLQKDRKKVQHVQFWGEAEGRKADRPGMHRAFVEFVRCLKAKSTAGRFSIDADPPRRWQFEGRPNSTMQELQATEHCIVSVKMSDPFFLVLLGPHIKAFYFERAKVAPSFDMVLILQVDGDVDVQIIQQIPAAYLETLCSWAAGLGYPVYQGPVPLNWGEIIDRVEEDPQAFEKEGGWGFLKWVGKDEAYDYEMSPREESSVASNVSSYDQEDKQSKEQLNKGSALANLLGGNLEDDDEIFEPEKDDHGEGLSDDDDAMSEGEEWE